MITMLKQGKDYIRQARHLYRVCVHKCSRCCKPADRRKFRGRGQTTPRQYGCCAKYGRRRRIRVCAFK